LYKKQATLGVACFFYFLFSSILNKDTPTKVSTTGHITKRSTLKTLAPSSG
jgi:hypothetical protein